MDTERIERALREGPVDEPRYAPGAFRRSRRRFSLALAGSVATAALVTGVLLGVVLTQLREPNGGVRGRDLGELAADLEGRWVSDVISREEWINSALAAGHDRNTIDAFFLHDPIELQVQYELVFADDHLQVFGAFDGSPSQGLAGGPYRLLDNGAVYYDDIGCFITARFKLSADRMTFEPISTESCNAEEGLANWVFFNLASYTRGEAP